MKEITVTMRRLPKGSIIRGSVAEVAYQIEKISGAVIACGIGAEVFRAGDRITETDAAHIHAQAHQEVVMLKGVE